MVLTALVVCPQALAQDEDDAEQTDLVAQDARARLQLQVRQARLELSLAGFGVQAVAAFRERLNRDLMTHVNRADPEFELTEQQKTKLILAGRGDIKRVLDRRQAIQERLERASADDPATAVKYAREIEDFQENLQRGIFGDESLFAKTMATTITREQRNKAVDRRRENRLAGYRLAVADAAVRLTPALGLSDEQARKLKKLLTDEINPPLQSGETDHAYIMFHFAHLPEAKVKPIFNDTQWKLLCKLRTDWESRDWFRKRGGS